MRRNAMSKKQTVVDSWDFDGMLASVTYMEEMKKLVINAADEKRPLTMADYEKLADIILEKYKEFFDERFKNSKAHHVLYVGSNRQDRNVDMTNGVIKKGAIDCTLSCFPFYEALAKKIGERYQVDIELNKLLLEDLIQGKPPGTHFNEASKAYLKLSPKFMEYLADYLKNPSSIKDNVTTEILTNITKELGFEGIPPMYYDDKYKALIIYTQMHDAKNKYGDGVVYRFVDDRHDILAGIKRNFDANGDTVPPGIVATVEQFLPPDSEGKKALQAEHKDPEAVKLFSHFERTMLKPTDKSVVDEQVYATTGTLHHVFNNDQDYFSQEFFAYNVDVFSPAVQEIRTVREYQSKEKDLKVSPLAKAIFDNISDSFKPNASEPRTYVKQDQDILRMITDEANFYAKSKKTVAKFMDDFTVADIKNAIEICYHKKNQGIPEDKIPKEQTLSFLEIYDELISNKKMGMLLKIQSKDRQELYKNIAINVSNEGKVRFGAINLPALFASLDKVNTHENKKTPPRKFFWQKKEEEVDLPSMEPPKQGLKK